MEIKEIVDLLEQYELDIMSLVISFRNYTRTSAVDDISSLKKCCNDLNASVISRFCKLKEQLYNEDISIKVRELFIITPTSFVTSEIDWKNPSLGIQKEEVLRDLDDELFPYLLEVFSKINKFIEKEEA